MMLPTFMLTIIWGTISTDATITLEVIGGLSNSTTLICQRNATIVCQIDDYGTFMSWQIDSATVIQCSGNRCANIAQPPSNIYFSSNTNTGLFSLTLSPVMKKDHGKIFRCNNHQIFKDVVANVADVSTTTVFVNNSMQVTTGCVTNASYVEFHWYTTNDTFGDEEPYQANNLLTTNVSCLNDSICGEATTSRITKTLTIEETGTADRYIKLLVRYTGLNFSETLFSKKAYKLGDKTETTTYSTVKLTPTPTNVITSTPNPVITSTQTIVKSPTPTTVVSPISTIVVAPSSTDKPPSNFSSTTDRKKSVIIGSSTGGGVILIIIISGFVCYIKRKRRNKKKAKKRMLSKEDANIQEIKL